MTAFARRSLLLALAAARGAGAADPVAFGDLHKTLVRPDDEAADSGVKLIVPRAAVNLLTDEERDYVRQYDSIFEKYSLYCSGRWLNVPVLQDAQDLMYLQWVLTQTRPRLVVETGTYKGGLTFFLATLMDLLGLPDTHKVVTVDRHPPGNVWDATWFCPPCEGCAKPWESSVWKRRVVFLQGLSDEGAVYAEIRRMAEDASYLPAGSPVFNEGAPSTGATRVRAQDGREMGLDELQRAEPPTGKVLITLDANHEFEGVLNELRLYGPLVSQDSFLVVQDAKLDEIWGKPAVTAATRLFLERSVGDFEHKVEVNYYAYSQHMYLYRAGASMGPDFFFQEAGEEL